MKRTFDVVVSTAAILLLLPLLFVLSLIVLFAFGRPIFFCQSRPGMKGRPFKMVKFRTMLNKVDANGTMLSDELRLTRLGKFLRSTSLDELPEIWNVLLGQMSFVGPRPLLMEYLPLYSKRQARRHETRPGITGWAQVNGRNAISWEEKFELDVWYVDNYSFWLDMKILWLTLLKVFKREGVNQEGHVTMEKFRGTPK